MADATEGFETLTARARALGNRGSYREAATLYRRATDLAAVNGDTESADKATCGRCAAEVELGNGAEVMPDLRRVLLNSGDHYICWLAAYTLARAHELARQNRKALFYARLSRQHSGYIDFTAPTGLAHNLLGNLLVADGREAEAATEYRAALRGAQDSPLTWVAGAEGNLGYCLVVSAVQRKNPRQSRMREGLRLIYRSLRTFRREGTLPYEVLPHLDLCFAHLELKRPTSAHRHGLRALELARQFSDSGTIRNALYLLGQVALLEGDRQTARQYFADLGQQFYPEHAGLADVLMSVDLRQVVNLRV